MSGYLLRHLIVTVILYACTYVIYSWNYWSNRIRQRNNPDGDADKERKLDIVVLIRWLIVPTFISLVILFLPMARLDERNTAFSSVGDSIIRAAQTFSLDSSVQDVWDIADGLGLSFSGWERGWMAFILTFAPVLTVVSAVTLFRLPKFWWAMLFPGKEICVFSDLN